MHGGATVWQTPAVDPELGLIYFSTGNPGPDFNGAVRAGDNLFSASIVAIEARTGKYRWHFQEVHHDLWDYDAPNPVVLFDVRDRRARAQRARASRQDGLGVHPRPRDRRAADRHRGAARAAGAAASDGRDAAVPARRRDRAAAGRHRARGLSARERRPHLHAVRRRQGHDREPEPLRRCELAAELVRSRAAVAVRLRVGRRRQLHRRRPRLRDSARRAALRGRRRRLRAAAAHGHLRGRRRHDEHARVAVSLARAVLQRLARDGRRSRVRRPQRRPLDGARLGHGTHALAVPDRRRHECADEHVRARRQAVRRRRCRPATC